MKRRNFLKTTAATALPVSVNGLGISSLAKSSLFDFINGDNDRVLVLVQLGGGNDGLNTIIPLDQYDRLANVRSNVIIPENQLLGITPEVALHPEMTGIKSLFEEAKLNIIQSVAYPNQNRSHFRSTDIWTSGSASDEFLDTGWMGRYFDSQYPEYPTGYPNDDCPDPFALTLGFVVSETCQGMASNFSGAVFDPYSATSLIVADDNSSGDGTCYEVEIDFLRTAAQQTNLYSTQIVAAANAGNNLATYPENNRLSEQLQAVSLLVSGGLKTKVYVVSLGGFDTHANQVVDGDPARGEHAELLEELNAAITAFQEDLQLLGIDKQVLTMTFSEFGRQIGSNGGFGTDHGTAAPMMFFGSCVNAAILGANPEIPEQVFNQEGVPMQFDFRSVYGSVLMDWFDVPETLIRELLYEDFQHLPIVAPCDSVATDQPVYLSDAIDTYHYPNPFSNWLVIGFTVPAGRVKVSVYDAVGREVAVLTNQHFSAGTHEVQLEGHRLEKGNFFYRIQTDHGVKTKAVVKQ